jgi:hypothetical protein
MTALPKPEIPFEDEESEEESEWSEEEEWDELHDAVGRVERRGADLADSVKVLKEICVELQRGRMEAIGHGAISTTERIVCAEIAACAALGDLTGVMRLERILSEIVQLEADLRCAKQNEYEIRFGSGPKS